MTGPDLDADALRAREFPLLRDVAYLNVASMGPVPERARRAVRAFEERRARAFGMEADDFLLPLSRSREAAARLVGADPDEIALGGNTSFGINLAALSLPVEPGTAVVISDREFPANVYPWMAREDLRLEIVPADPLGRPDEARLLERLDRGDVSVFALSAVQFTDGFRADLEGFGRFCRERGIFFVVDAIQAAGQIPIDVRAAQIDVLASGGHKWLCSPFGTGFLYVRRELIPRLVPRAVGWTGMRSAGDLRDLLDYAWDPYEDARRFEPGTLPFQDFVGFAESLGLLLEVGVARIERHVTGVLEPLVAWLAARSDVEVTSDLRPSRRSGIVSFRPPSCAGVRQAFRAAGIEAAEREGAVRLAAHLYNTRAEAERVVEVLETLGAVGWR
jgi:cysteine desulfurase / selenocysteine lyase